MLKERPLVGDQQIDNSYPKPSIEETFQQVYCSLIRTLGANVVSEMTNCTPEDIVQRAALRLLPHWEDYMNEDGSNPQGLFYTTSLRIQKDAGRMRQRGTYETPFDTTELILEDETAEQAFQEVECAQNSITELSAAAGLTGSEIEIIKMHYLSGNSQQQIADQLGIKVGTVKSRLSRSVQKLRNYATQRGITRSSLDLFDL